MKTSSYFLISSYMWNEKMLLFRKWNPKIGDLKKVYYFRITGSEPAYSLLWQAIWKMSYT